ncbi:MAG: M48 family metallopeptidase [Bdellovibrionota bacterium]
MEFDNKQHGGDTSSESPRINPESKNNERATGSVLQTSIPRDRFDLSQEVLPRHQSGSKADIRNEDTKLSEPESTSAEVGRRYFRSMVSLNTGIAVAGTAIVASHAAVLSTLLPKVLMSAPNWLLGTVSATTALGLYARFAMRRKGINDIIEASGSKRWNGTQYKRVTQSLERLSTKLGQPLDLHVFVGDRLDRQMILGKSAKRLEAAAVDRLAKKDVLMFDKDVVAKLSDTELDGIVAHEVSHLDRTHSRFKEIASFLEGFSKPVVLWGVGLSAFHSLAGGYGTFLAGTVAPIAAATASAAAVAGFGLIKMFISRKNEMKTDLRAVQLTGDPDAYCSALEKISDPRNARNPADGKINRILEMFSTHPSLSERIQAVKRVFGGES